MTGSPFANVVGTDADSSTFTNVESTQVSDTTSASAVAARDNPGESSIPILIAQDHSEHESGQDETAGQSDTSGTPAPA